MYSRILNPPSKKSFFLFGPRGTGKTTWLKIKFPNAVYLDLLDAEIFNDLVARPERIERFIPPSFNNFVIIDEVQRIPELLNEAHRLIEQKKYNFILTGSSARKLRGKGVNLLAGRALTYNLYPLTATELGKDFSIEHALRFGHLPATFNESNKKKYLESYVMTYLEQEVRQEGLTRNIGSFSRFLEIASFSQGSITNVSQIARDCGINRKVAENYFSILYDLMIAYRLPFFAKRAKRKAIQHEKFYFFDTGIYQTIRPRGPLDTTEEIGGTALETLVFQELKAFNDYLGLDYQLSFWKSPQGHEVDFILYGKRGIKAIEVKRTSIISEKHFRGLKAFTQTYPLAKSYLLYGGERKMWEGNIQIIPVVQFLKNMRDYI